VAVSKRSAVQDLAFVDGALLRAMVKTDEPGAAQACELARRPTPGAALPPLGNTGGNSAADWIPPRFIIENGQCKEIPARRGYGGQAAFIDWINLTFHEDELCSIGNFISVTDEEVVLQVSRFLDRIMGFGVTAQRERGMNFYERSYDLGDGWGVVCHGGQRGTVLISISGEGCAAASVGWEKRLFDWMQDCRSSRITRVDLAYDDFEGVHKVDDVKEWHVQGLFTIRRTPSCEMRGDWINPSGKGRSFYVGSRENGKMLRAYEKGKQLGDETSEWLRFEGELRNVDRIIPLHVLLEPGAYLAALYPALAWISEVQSRIPCVQKTAEMKVEACLDWLKDQCGGALWVMSELMGGAEPLLERIMRVGDFPKRLKVPDGAMKGKAFHEREPLYLPELANLMTV